MSADKKSFLDTLGTPNDWIAHAKSDLALAQLAHGNSPAEIFNEQICFHAQQATEKALKAVLISRQIEFALKYDISYLLELLENAAIAIPQELQSADSLTPYAVAFRYPGQFADDEVTFADVEEAIFIARETISWAEAIIASPDSTP